MKIRSDLPIKYYLNVHNEEDLQDDLAVLFDITQYLIRVAVSKAKEPSPANFKFSTKGLKYIFGDRITDETIKPNLVKRIKSLIALEHLRIDGDTIYVTEKGLANFYTIE